MNWTGEKPSLWIRINPQVLANNRHATGVAPTTTSAKTRPPGISTGGRPEDLRDFRCKRHLIIPSWYNYSFSKTIEPSRPSIFSRRRLCAHKGADRPTLPAPFQNRPSVCRARCAKKVLSVQNRCKMTDVEKRCCRSRESRRYRLMQAGAKNAMQK